MILSCSEKTAVIPRGLGARHGVRETQGSVYPRELPIPPPLLYCSGWLFLGMCVARGDPGGGDKFRGTDPSLTSGKCRSQVAVNGKAWTYKGL